MRPCGLHAQHAAGGQAKGQRSPSTVGRTALLPPRRARCSSLHHALACVQHRVGRQQLPQRSGVLVEVCLPGGCIGCVSSVHTPHPGRLGRQGVAQETPSQGTAPRPAERLHSAASPEAGHPTQPRPVSPFPQALQAAAPKLQPGQLTSENLSATSSSPSSDNGADAIELRAAPWPGCASEGVSVQPCVQALRLLRDQVRIALIR